MEVTNGLEHSYGAENLHHVNLLLRSQMMAPSHVQGCDAD